MNILHQADLTLVPQWQGGRRCDWFHLVLLQRSHAKSYMNILWEILFCFVFWGFFFPLFTDVEKIWRGTEPRLNLFLENPVSVRLPCLKREQTSTMCQGMPGESRGAIILDFTLRLWSVNTTPDCNAEAHLNNVRKKQRETEEWQEERLELSSFLERKKKNPTISPWFTEHQWCFFW